MKVTQIPTEVYSRVSGYFRPMQQWNRGKREEFSERKFANIKELEKRDESIDEVL